MNITSVQYIMNIAKVHYEYRQVGMVHYIMNVERVHYEYRKGHCCKSTVHNEYRKSA